MLYVTHLDYSAFESKRLFIYSIFLTFLIKHFHTHKAWTVDPLQRFHLFAPLVNLATVNFMFSLSMF